MAEESKLQTKILEDLRSYGKNIVAFKIQKTSDNGIPDVFFTTLRTGAVFIEVKKKGEKPTALQNKKIRDLSKCGCLACYCSSWEEWTMIKLMVQLSHE